MNTEQKEISNKLRKYIFSSLTELGCPFIEDTDENSCSELLLEPGEARLRILQWIFLRFDVKLSDIIAPVGSISSSIADARVRRLLYVASALGMCSSEDVELIRGMSPCKKQEAFIRQLLEMTIMVEQINQVHVTSPKRGNQDLVKVFKEDCQVIDSLGSIGTGKLFTKSCDFLPSDMKLHVEQTWKEAGYTSKNKPPQPKFDILIKHAQDLSLELEKYLNILEDLQKVHTPSERDAKLDEKISKQLQILLPEMVQICRSYSFDFENEIVNWCNISPPVLTALGPVIKRVYDLQSKFSKVLDSIKRLKNSYSTICDTTREAVSKISKKEKKSGFQVSNSYQENLITLEESIRRMNKTLENVA